MQYVLGRDGLNRDVRGRGVPGRDVRGRDEPDRDVRGRDEPGRTNQAGMKQAESIRQDESDRVEPVGDAPGRIHWAD